jgi:hypothetical protein
MPTILLICLATPRTNPYHVPTGSHGGLATVHDQYDHVKSALSDRYRIERELGSGGMATVYLAEDLKHHRKVAVKVLRPELAATRAAPRTCTKRGFVASADGGTLRQITSHAARDAYGSWSPDGTGFVFISWRTGRAEIWMLSRSADGGWGEARQLTSDGGEDPRWSRDGRLISYINDNSVWTIPRDGGDAQLVVRGVDDGDATLAVAAEWSVDGRTIYYRADDGSFWSVPAGGGEARCLIVFDNPIYQSHIHVKFATDGDRFYFTMSEQESDIWVMEVGSN